MKADLSLRRQAGLPGKARRLSLRGEEGGSLVEFAILMPVMFVLLGIAASFTLGLYNLQQLGCATTTAVELVGAQQGSTTDPCELAMNTVQGTLPGWTAANLSYTLTVTGENGTVTSYPSSSNGGSTAYSCTAAGAGGGSSTEEAPNTPVVLKVSYTYSWLPLPNFHPFGSLTPTTPLTVTQTTMAD
jgi:Flp pilus assembly protein TadG